MKFSVLKCVQSMVLCLVFMLTGVTELYAQTSYTSKIKNPSFESGTTGWTVKNVVEQGNDVFTLKSGSIYMEKWTGRGGAVGSASVSQTVTTLPPGNYELTVAAQNIQEDTPTSAQTGAWIYANDVKTTVTVRAQYTVAFDCIDGTVTIGFEAVNASGNWLAFDNFRLTQVGTNLSSPLASAITVCQTLYGDGSGRQAEQLLSAINAALAVQANTSATVEEQAEAIIGLNEAADIFRRANADPDDPIDLTSLIVNSSFEEGDFSGWTAVGMALQGNNVFNIKNGTWYAERWTGRGGAVGDGSVLQVVEGLQPGHYLLKAKAQNIQEDTPTSVQSGAAIVAGSHSEPVTIRKDYTLDFVQVSEKVKIGFRAVGATGNWLAVDHFRLEYVGDDFDDVKAEYQRLIAVAQTLSAKRINASALQKLQTAINESAALVTQSTTSGWASAAARLEDATEVAEASQAIFAQLAVAIDAARAEIQSSSAGNKANYQAAIDVAQQVYDNTATTDSQASAAIEALTKAAFEFKIENGTGAKPTVVTDPRFIRGCQWAFGRCTVTGSNILEEGFCWSESPDPKVTDNRTREYINQAGKIYWLRDLKPATVYYMRAYAITKTYAVGYGDVIKFVTVPKGTVGHWYNNGGDQATNDRINYAIDLSMDYYWNNLTSIHGFGISVNYSPGTPTADCSYGGWMRVGESSSYQQPGTIMHEAFHGIGVGTHGMWWNGDMRSAGDRGDWLGDRATEAVRFWDNSTTAVITGDNMHLWPYGCNGAHEDTHSDNLYCMMGILAQALNEDGLPGSGEIGYALPYYALNHEDGVKYYIKNESESRGLYTSYLVETSAHQLQWQAMTLEEAKENDAAAWYITFTPSNQYYQLRNAATGYYMTYNGSAFRTVSRTSTPTSAEDFHLMRGRVDVREQRGYYIIHPESSANPPTLTANANSVTASSAWNISKTATTQRWLIMTEEEAEIFDNGNMSVSLEAFRKMVANVRGLMATPHTQTVSDADNTLTQQLSSLEAQAATCTKSNEVDALTAEVRADGMDFLSGVSASDTDNPFDLTFLLENPDFDTDAITGWTTTNSGYGYGEQGVEYFEKTFNFSQTLTGMPAGFYRLRANAFQRPGAAESVYTAYAAGTAQVTTSLLINTTYAAVHHICDDRQPSAVFNDGGWGSDVRMSDGTYIPNCMLGAEKYFAKELYDSEVTAQNTASNSSLKVGIRCTSAPASYWTMFDHFRLYYFGQDNDPTGVDEVKTTEPVTPNDGTIYDLMGRKLREKPASGYYIQNGKIYRK
jgi:hypothetical protein